LARPTAQFAPPMSLDQAAKRNNRFHKAPRRSAFERPEQCPHPASSTFVQKVSATTNSAPIQQSRRAALGRKQRFKLRHYRKAPAKAVAAAPKRPASGKCNVMSEIRKLISRWHRDELGAERKAARRRCPKALAPILDNIRKYAMHASLKPVDEQHVAVSAGDSAVYVLTGRLNSSYGRSISPLE
jgi:hypothetical protein